MNKHILSLFLSLTLLLSLAACGGNADTTDARRDANEIVVGIAQDLENSLDPYTSVTASNRCFSLFHTWGRNIFPEYRFQTFRGCRYRLSLSAYTSRKSCVVSLIRATASKECLPRIRGKKATVAS